MILKCESCIESWIFPTFFDWLLFIPGPRPLTLLSIYACLLVKHVQLAMDESFLTLPLPFVTQFFSFISRENWNLRVFKMKSANTVRNWSIDLTRMTKKSEWFYNCILIVGWCFCYQGVHLRKNIRAMVMLMDLFFKR